MYEHTDQQLRKYHNNKYALFTRKRKDFRAG